MYTFLPQAALCVVPSRYNFVLGVKRGAKMCECTPSCIKRRGGLYTGYVICFRGALFFQADLLVLPL